MTLKKTYEGLRVAFIPINGDDILTQSKPCELISEQYYASQDYPGACVSDDPTSGEPFESWNWNSRPHA